MSGYQRIQQKIKDLESRLATAVVMPGRINILNALSRELFVYEVDRSMQYAREARKLASEINYDRGIAMSLNNEALCCRIKSDFRKSKQVATEALKIFERIGDKGGQADALNNIAFMEVNTEDYENALQHALKALALAQEADEKDVQAFACLVNGMVSELLGDYPQAIDYHLKSLSLSREAEDVANEGASLINLGIVFRKIGEREKAKEHFESAYKLFQDLQIKLLEASSLYNLGTAYSEFGDYARALDHFKQSLQIQKDIGHAQGQGACYINIGIMFMRMRKFAEAEENIRQSIELARSFGKKNHECKGMLHLAEVYLEQQDGYEAINILEEAHNEAEIYGIKEVRYQILQALSRAYEMNGDFRKAFSFYKDATALRDELINEESTQKNRGLMLLHEVQTARREREIAIRDKERAEQSEKFKEQFLANMSHEIRTPMNAIVGLVNLLSKSSLNALQAKYLKAIHQSSDHLLSIIQDILDFSKIEAGQISLEVINFSIRECMESVHNTLQYNADEKKITLEYSCDEKIPELLSGDPARLKQIFINLVSNAIKFTENGSVRFSASVQKKENSSTSIAFKVEDTGIGIPEDMLDDIFKSFVQASSSTTRKYGGTGLGLSISQHLVEMQGGSISVKSKMNEGTTFTFVIPYHEAMEDIMVSLPEAPEAMPAIHGIRVLVAEDNKFNQMVAIDSLESMIPGVKIEVAVNGRVALEKIRSAKFDLVLLDLQMPEMDGYEVAVLLRNDENILIREIPIIALTANATKTEREKCLKQGMNGYVAKPFKSEELLKQIHLVLSAEISK
ncbi:MAG TPA: tetratricopeptide repeat protein [Chitinophagales bacterium]|nr:tetratricopeptide repeat protein [Chitinophagales bacterium]